MKETAEFVPVCKVFKWDQDDWNEGWLKIDLPKDSKLVGWQVYMWKEDRRVPILLEGKIDENRLALWRGTATWEGCVTVSYMLVPTGTK